MSRIGSSSSRHNRSSSSATPAALASFGDPCTTRHEEGHRCELFAFRTATHEHTVSTPFENQTMKHSAILLITALLNACLSQTATGDDRFFEELFAPVRHTHYSPLGTPYVHPFTFEPPQIHQDAFFIYKYTQEALIVSTRDMDRKERKRYAKK